MTAAIVISIIVGLVGSSLVTVSSIFGHPELVNSLIMFDNYIFLSMFSFGIFLLAIILPGLLFCIASESSDDETRWRISHVVVGLLLMGGYIALNYFTGSKNIDVESDVLMMAYKVSFLWGGPAIFSLSCLSSICVALTDEEEKIAAVSVNSIVLHLALFFATLVITFIVYNIKGILTIIFILIIALIILALIGGGSTVTYKVTTRGGRVERIEETDD